MLHSESTMPLAAARIPGRNRTHAQSRANSASPIWSGFVRNPAVSLGVFLGFCFSATGLAWLLLANRVAYLEVFAFERNLSLAIVFVLLGLVPTCRFRKSPGRSFLCGIIAWAILTATYSATELHFCALATRLSAFHLFVLGGAPLGILPASAWVLNLVILLRKASFR
jgi:hypothetical protein